MIEKKIYSKLKMFYRNEKEELHEPCFSKHEKLEILKCLKSTYVSTKGKNTKKFEKKIKLTTKSKYSVAIINATTGIFICLKTLGVKEGDEVLVPSLTFIGSVNPIAYCNATPHFVDLNNDLMDIDYDRLDHYLSSIVNFKNGKCYNKNTNKVIKAIIPVHLFGHPSNMRRCLSLAKKYQLKIVEDCAESFGSKYQGRHVGNFGSMGVISFNGNKIITTGGGGAIITNSKKIYSKINHICSTSKIVKNHRIFHNEIGYNFKMPSLNASLGLAQIQKLKNFIKKKRWLYKKYVKVLSDTNEYKIMKEPINTFSNYWLQTIILNDKNKQSQKKIIKYLNKKGVGVRPPWQPIHTLKPYKKCPKMILKNTSKASASLIHLPSGANVGHSYKKVDM